MPAVNNVLVVGSGLAGTATAVHLASRGVAVDLVEIKHARQPAGPTPTRGTT